MPNIDSNKIGGITDLQNSKDLPKDRGYTFHRDCNNCGTRCGRDKCPNCGKEISAAASGYLDAIVAAGFKRLDEGSIDV